MAEKLRTEQKGFKVWKNPERPSDAIRFMGEFYPPAGRGFLTGTDLKELGLARGNYTLLAPPHAPHCTLFSKWQTAVVSE